jgi:CheY-like chemotaxis protein
MAKILLVGNELGTGERFLNSLRQEKYDVFEAASPVDAQRQIARTDFDLALIDITGKNFDALELLDSLRKHRPNTMILTYTKRNETAKAAAALARGAFDNLIAPVSDKDLKSTISSALAERRQMQSRGYAYKDPRRGDRALIKKGVLTAIMESFLVGLSLILGYLLQLRFFRPEGYATFIGGPELIFIALALACSYAFAFVLRHSHRRDLLGSGRQMVGHLFVNLAYAHIIQLALLFLIKDINFTIEKPVIGLSFISGLFLLVVARLLIAPAVIYRPAKEGKKRLIIKSRAVKPAIAEKSSMPGIPEVVSQPSHSQPPESHISKGITSLPELAGATYRLRKKNAGTAVAHKAQPSRSNGLKIASR